MTDVVDLAHALIAQPSLTGSEGPAVELAASWLSERGWHVTHQELSPGHANIWASRGHGAVTLSTHLDTVPPFIGPSRKGAQLAGRGACAGPAVVASPERPYAF